MLLAIIISTVLISMISLIGIVFSQKHIKDKLHYFISFAAGVLIAATFMDLVPEALENISISADKAMLFIVIGIVMFYLMERFIHWHHCDKESCDAKPAGLLILTGDFIHNFFDGLLIAGAFLLDFSTGIAVSISVAIHEIPQELGDFAVLIHSGFSKKKALILNFLSALSAIIGGIIGFFLFETSSVYAPFAVLITGGGFLYIALSDIVPEMHKHAKNKRMVLIEAIIFVGTIIISYFLFSHVH